MIETVEEGLEVYRSVVRDYIKLKNEFNFYFPDVTKIYLGSNPRFTTYSNFLSLRETELKAMEKVLKLLYEEREKIWNEEKEKLHETSII